MITVTQTLTEHDIRLGAETYYSIHPMSKFRNMLALILICIGVYGLFYKSLSWVGILFIGYGIFMLMRRILYVKRAVKLCRLSPHFGTSDEITITEEGSFTIKNDHTEGSMDLKIFYGYHPFDGGVLILNDKDMWYLLKKSGISDYDSLLGVLERSGLQKR